MVEKRQNKWLLQKQHFCCSPAMSKSSKLSKKWFQRRIKIFAKSFKWVSSVVHSKDSTFCPLGGLVKILIQSQNPFFENLLYFDCWRSEVLFWKQPLVIPFPSHKSATTSHTNSNRVSNSKLKHGIWNCVKTEMIKYTVPPQEPHKQSTISWDTLYNNDGS